MRAVLVISKIYVHYSYERVSYITLSLVEGSILKINYEKWSNTLPRSLLPAGVLHELAQVITFKYGPVLIIGCHRDRCSFSTPEEERESKPSLSLVVLLRRES